MTPELCSLVSLISTYEMGEIFYLYVCKCTTRGCWAYISTLLKPTANWIRQISGDAVSTILTDLWFNRMYTYMSMSLVRALGMSRSLWQMLSTYVVALGNKWIFLLVVFYGASTQYRSNSADYTFENVNQTRNKSRVKHILIWMWAGSPFQSPFMTCGCRLALSP